MSLALGLAPGLAAAAEPVVAKTEPLVMTGTFTSRPGKDYLGMAMNQYIIPSHEGTEYRQPVGVITPEQAWPITGITDYTFGTSVRIGLRDLEREIAEHEGEPMIIFGYSQSAVIGNIEKRRLAEQFPDHDDPEAPDIEFFFIGNLNRPNGGVMERFPGVYIPFINFYFNGPALTDTQFITTDFARQYDGFADFPNYPLNPVATLNALLGIAYVHTDYEAVGIGPGYPDAINQGTYGDTTYYLYPTPDLPLFDPLRSLGVPEHLIDIVEPVTTVFVELGYDRSIKPWEPTPARLIPPIDPAKTATDLLAAIGTGIQNGLAPAPAPVRTAVPFAPTDDSDARIAAEPTPTIDPTLGDKSPELVVVKDDSEADTEKKPTKKPRVSHGLSRLGDIFRPGQRKPAATAGVSGETGSNTADETASNATDSSSNDQAGGTSGEGAAA